MSFQENLRRCREAAGFSSARAFAEHIGVPYTTYISYENKNAEPKYDKLCQIAAALGVTTDELLGYDPAKKNPQFRVSEYSISNNHDRGLITITFASVDAHRTPEAFGEFIGQVARWCEQQDSMEIADAINQAPDGQEVQTLGDSRGPAGSRERR